MRAAGLASLAMVKRRRQLKRQRPHVKYAGVTDRTLSRYRKAVLSFFLLLDHSAISTPLTLAELDQTVSEFINHQYSVPPQSCRDVSKEFNYEKPEHIQG